MRNRRPRGPGARPLYSPAMQVGFIGSGNMASALARGWGEPVLCTDAFREKAEALAAETGGEAVSGNGELADRADVVILAHKPAQLEEVAEQVGGRAKAVVSILGGVPLERVKAAYDGVPVVRVLPSTPVEVRRGVTVHARDADGDPQLTGRVQELFGRLGTLVTIDEAQMDTAMALMSCAPAYFALVAEAQVDGGVKHGIPADLAARLVVGTMEGTAALLEHREHDSLAVRREVTSPGGATARGLAALERGGLRAAFLDAMDAVAGR
jgi:pyrroline-5-carboxylate reductase